MTKHASFPQYLDVWITLENTTSGLTGLTALGPLYNDTAEGTLVQLKRLTKVDWGAFEQMFEEIPTTDVPHNVRAPLRDNATLTVELLASYDDAGAEVSDRNLMAAAADWPMGVSSSAAGAAAYNFLDDDQLGKANDLLGWAVEVVQYAEDGVTVVWRRRLHNCKLDAKHVPATGGKPARIEVTFSDARYIDQDTTDVGATHSDS